MVYRNVPDYVFQVEGGIAAVYKYKVDQWLAQIAPKGAEALLRFSRTFVVVIN